MITNFSDMIAEYDDVIPADKCKEIIDKFEYDQRKSKGITAADTEGKATQESIKKSTDLWISQWPEWEEYDHYFFEKLSPHVKQYLMFIKERLGDDVQSKGDLVDSGYQIQRTNVGEGYGWHADDDVSPILDTIVFPLRGYTDSGSVLCARRLFTYMWYLNDDFSGGETQFRVGPGKDDIFSVAPKQGKLICFPASWYFHHRGDIVTKGSKYVCTGWLSDHVTTFSNDTTGLSEQFRKDAKSAGRKMLLQFNQTTGRIELDDAMKKQKQNADTFKGMYPKLSELDTIVDESTQDRGI
tara:strand:- start:8182 stop:9072 length:891 start_codon:yes stop_codon:yes gene_type:complete